MTQPLTDSTLVIANRFFDILDANKASLGIQDVWFGDQQLVPRVPALCVEPGTKRRVLQGVPDLTLNEIDTHFLLYHSPVADSQTSRRAAIAFAEAVETFLHENHLRLHAANGDQLTIHGFMAEMDPAYSFRPGTLHHAAVMTWTSTTKRRLQT
jgi:hypothetical protein